MGEAAHSGQSQTKEIVSGRLTNERVHDRGLAEPLIRDAGQGVQIVKLLRALRHEMTRRDSLLNPEEAVWRVRKGFEASLRLPRDTHQMLRLQPADLARVEADQSTTKP